MIDPLFYNSIPTLPVTPGLRAKLAAYVLLMSKYLDKPFSGDRDGWRIRVDRIREHRTMAYQDLDVDSEREE